MAVSVTTQPTFVAGRPKILFERRLDAYDVAPDGRFLMYESNPEAAPTQLIVVFNWFEELKRLVAAANYCRNLRSGRVRSENNLEGSFPSGPEAKYGEITVESQRLIYPEPLHDGEAGSVHDGEVLVGERLRDRPSHLKVRSGHRFDLGQPSLQPRPEALGGLSVQSMSQQKPGLD